MEDFTRNPWLLALGLVLIIEALMPMLSPSAWRDAVRKMTELPDGQLRLGGIVMASLGLLLIWSS
ncbi:MAG: DUF2065 domain-containing protein [Lautropia sp.]|nr:DUF2065 domain-containing protein [Lautropia sp.]